MAVAAGLHVGKYEVGRKLGQGGFGILYVGRDTELDREVALKFLRPEHVTRPDVVMRFLQEARSAAKINHPGIVTVFECGQVAGTNTRADGTVYIAMELLAGESLSARLKRERVLPPATAIGIVRQVCSALQAAHSAGIVHRDLKPDNIFLVPDPAVRDGLRVKVLDFGVAKLADGQFGGGVRTHSAMVLGTPNYMSPEQCKSSAKVDHRSDIYAVGCILFELVCGRRPYDGDAGEQIAKHQLAPVPVPREINAAVPESIDRLVTQMLAKSPDERPGSMEFVDEALAQFERAPTVPAGGAPFAPGDGETVPEAIASTMFEGEHAPTKVSSERKPARWPLAAGAGGALALGVIIALVVSRGGGTEVPAKAQEPEVAAQKPDRVVAPPAAAEAPDDVRRDCQRAADQRHWTELLDCSDRLSTIDAAQARAYRIRSAAEIRAQGELERIKTALAANDLDTANAALRAIPPDSVYLAEATARVIDVNGGGGSAGSGSGPPGCDADALRQKGEDHLQTGMDAAALAAFEASMKCRPDAALMRFAFMAACRAKNGEKARYYYPKLPQATTTGIVQICVRNGVDLPGVDAPSPAPPKRPAPRPTVADQPPPESCDAAALLQKGQDHLQSGMDAAALAAFEASMKCKPDAAVLRLAFLAACRGRNAAKAKYYFPKLPVAVTTGIVQVCVRNGIALP